ncbi:MAG: ParB N-terminal domain-containing protein [Pseudomonadota bacterium]
MKTQQLNPKQIETSKRVSVRKKTDHATADDYAEAMKNGAVFPPIVVFNEKGTERFIVADGAHRLRAAIESKQKTIKCEVRHGSEIDALEYALGCNLDHGLRMSRSDRLHAIGQLMGTPELARKYSNHEQRADLLHISKSTFQRLLRQWRESNGGTSTERAAKDQAKEDAAKFTVHQNGERVSNDTLEPQGKPRQPRPSDVRPTAPAPSQEELDGKRISDAIREIVQTGRDYSFWLATEPDDELSRRFAAWMGL